MRAQSSASKTEFSAVQPSVAILRECIRARSASHAPGQARHAPAQCHRARIASRMPCANPGSGPSANTWRPATNTWANRASGWKTPARRADGRRARPAARATRYPPPRSRRAARWPSRPAAAPQPPCRLPARPGTRQRPCSRTRPRARRRCAGAGPGAANIRAAAAPRCQLRVTWLSEPIDQLPLWPIQAGRSKMPSPRLASVLGHSTIEAPLAAHALQFGRRAVRGMHQVPARVQRRLARSSHSTGRGRVRRCSLPPRGCCSAIWIWIGMSAPAAAADFAQRRLVDRAQRVQRDAGRDPRRPRAPACTASRRCAAPIGRGREPPLVLAQARRRRNPSACTASAAASGRCPRAAPRAPAPTTSPPGRHRAGRRRRCADSGTRRLACSRPRSSSAYRKAAMASSCSGVMRLRGAVHAVAPAPEIVVAAVAALGQAGDGALERVAVAVDQPGQHRARQPLSRRAALRAGASGAISLQQPSAPTVSSTSCAQAPSTQAAGAR